MSKIKDDLRKKAASKILDEFHDLACDYSTCKDNTRFFQLQLMANEIYDLRKQLDKDQK